MMENRGWPKHDCHFPFSSSAFVFSGRELFRARAEIDLLRRGLKYIWHLGADVAELADAPDSKSGIREDVWVRPPPSAPCK